MRIQTLLALAIVGASTLAAFPSHANTCNPPAPVGPGPVWNTEIPTGCEIRVAIPYLLEDIELADLTVETENGTPVEAYVVRLEETLTAMDQDFDCNNSVLWEREVTYHQIEVHPVDRWPAGTVLRLSWNNDWIRVAVAMNNRGVCAPEVEPDDTFCQPPLGQCLNDVEPAVDSGVYDAEADLDGAGCSGSSSSPTAWPLVLAFLAWFYRRRSHLSC